MEDWVSLVLRFAPKFINKISHFTRYYILCLHVPSKWLLFRSGVMQITHNDADICVKLVKDSYSRYRHGRPTKPHKPFTILQRKWFSRGGKGKSAYLATRDLLSGQVRTEIGGNKHLLSTPKRRFFFNNPNSLWWFMVERCQDCSPAHLMSLVHNNIIDWETVTIIMTEEDVKGTRVFLFV